MIIRLTMKDGRKKKNTGASLELPASTFRADVGLMAEWRVKVLVSWFISA